MKKHLLFIVFVMAGICQVYAQGQNRIGGHLGYGTKDLNFGFGAQAEFSLSDKFSIAPKFNYFLGKTTATSFGDVSAKGWTLDGDVHYYFTSDKTAIYGLAGLTYATAIASFSGSTVSDSKLGLNLGAGVNFSTDKSFIPYLEIKYNTPFEALFITAGVNFPLGK